jgi:hypothetical protein
MAKIKIKGYKREDGVLVRSHFTKDKGKPGKTPEKDKWYEPGRETGWDKDEPQEKRIRMVISSENKNLSPHNRNLRAFRQMNSLANVTTDSETEKKARSDAEVFRRRL